MSFRTVVISQRCKLDLKLGYLVIRREEDTKRVFLDEIDVLLIENPACALTGCLLEALVTKKIKVIFCDSKHLPLSELMPYYGSCNCARKVREQIEWDPVFSKKLWTEIVFRKIQCQALLLKRHHKEIEADLLFEYANQVQPGDSSNREGHAAKVYFNALFGMGFSREEDIASNSALNYGYALIMSAVSREIVSCGFLTQIGIGHRNTFNDFNLSCDFMEPYRILVDDYVINCDFKKFETEEKHCMVKLLEQKVKIADSRQTLLNSIRIYVQSIFHAIREQDTAHIRFYEF